MSGFLVGGYIILCRTYYVAIRTCDKVLAGFDEIGVRVATATVLVNVVDDEKAYCYGVYENFISGGR